jgi:hypothetical protein
VSRRKEIRNYVRRHKIENLQKKSNPKADSLKRSIKLISIHAG